MVGAIERDEVSKFHSSVPASLEKLLPFVEQERASLLALRFAVAMPLPRGAPGWNSVLSAFSLRLSPSGREPFARILADVIKVKALRSPFADEVLARLVPELSSATRLELISVLTSPSKTSAIREESLNAAISAAVQKETSARDLIRYLAFKDFSELEQPTRRSDISRSLINLTAALGPSARRSRMLAVAVWLEQRPKFQIDTVSPSQFRNFETIRIDLNEADLVEILKWPFCVGEAQKLVMRSLEDKLSKRLDRTVNLGGDLDKLVAEAKDLGVEDLDKPARRPTLADALHELGPPGDYLAGQPPASEP